MKPAVSVIILVYKAERYIERCARALFGQTLQDIEYVFVDDGTPDSSFSILDRVLLDFPARRPMVKILHNEVNRGQAYSRRRGVEAATGEYIIHCDSDDWPEPEMYSKLYCKARDENLDMVICRMQRIYSDRVEPMPDASAANDLVETLMYHDLRHYLLNKLISRKMYEEPITWPEKNMCEDSALIVQLSYYCRRWAFMPDILYNYNYSPDSISSAANTIEKVEQMRANTDIAISFIESKGLGKKYAGAIMHAKCWIRSVAFTLPRNYYISVYPEVNIPFFFDTRFTLGERLGHLTTLLGIHGISKIFKRSR